MNVLFQFYFHQENLLNDDDVFVLLINFNRNANEDQIVAC